ncbi:hypothetical protein [Desulfosediminicola ganghwensis]|nr:hypothetical protein [Desulfosediminicola ganghwensis]
MREDNMSFKDEWDLASALKVLQHPTVDGKLWAEAVEWLLKYGPPSIKKILLEASQTATEMQFPELEPSHHTADGEPVYDVAQLAITLGISEEEVLEIIAKKGVEKEPLELFDSENVSKTIH